MSDKIYFNTSQKFNLRRSLINAGTRIHHKVAPKHARKVARQLLLTPVRSKPKNAQPAGLIIGTVSSAHGDLTTYTLGEGPIWVLNHGWSGTANQFFPLMEAIAKQGFTAVAYDQPAHGTSGGAYGHIPAFVQGLEAVLESVGEIQGIIAHSMGTASTLECKHEKALGCPLLLIAPVLEYLENLFGSVKRSGYSMKLFEEVVEQVSDEYHYPIHSIDPYSKLKQRANTTIIVHDEADKFTSFEVSERAAQEMDNVTLVATKGLGHGRIMNSDPVKQSFTRLTEHSFNTLE
ncbi:esterase [Vibrio sp. UCD-FRSSP16_10]|uniref:alpha/beta hydrolase n=1 Tax=unclassified Vibrio TaxID=2614977 RepID=UPI0007FEF149|nr:MULTISPECIES: alpha/beta fold hydrolase [unclassified Vibrio]OBT13650.1 esterase [Vibrio sp. UCD-FRSSP16_30]OBT19204.1 esterase [Vibrio sp. UCD-FRSSP16_10]